MNVYVCVKQIPDTATPGRIDPGTRRLVREGVQTILDPADEVGLEAGLQLVEKHGGAVTVVSMGPASAQEAIRRALAMGAERGVLVTDPGLAGSDAPATAAVLAAAIKRESFDLIICASESTDASTGMVPGQIAEILDLPAVTFARDLAIDGSRLTAKRQTEAGYQVIETSLPALVAVGSGINEPRYPSLKGIMGAKKKELVQLSLSDLGLPAASVGEAGARERVVAVTAAEQRKAGEVVTDEGEGGRMIAAFLERQKLI